MSPFHQPAGSDCADAALASRRRQPPRRVPGTQAAADVPAASVACAAPGEGAGAEVRAPGLSPSARRRRRRARAKARMMGRAKEPISRDGSSPAQSLSQAELKTGPLPGQPTTASLGGAQQSLSGKAPTAAGEATPAAGSNSSASRGRRNRKRSQTVQGMPHSEPDPSSPDAEWSIAAAVDQTVLGPVFASQASRKTVHPAAVESAPADPVTEILATAAMDPVDGSLPPKSAASGGQDSRRRRRARSDDEKARVRTRLETARAAGVAPAVAASCTEDLQVRRGPRAISHHVAGAGEPLEPGKVRVIYRDGRELTPCDRKKAEQEVALGRAKWVGRHTIRLRYDPFRARRIRRRILDRDAGVCAYCGAAGDTIDHLVPWSLGGRTTMDNCVTSCAECNFRRGNRPVREFVALEGITVFHALVLRHLAHHETEVAPDLGEARGQAGS